MNLVGSPSGPKGPRPSTARTTTTARAMRVLEAVLAPIVYPRSAEELLREVFPRLSTTEVLAEIVNVKSETRDTTTLVLRPNGLFQGHRAGQWITLEAEIAGVRRTRCFSISSAPYSFAAKGTIEVTIKAVPGGAVTPTLVSEQKRGTIVTISQAQGTFVLPEVAPVRPLFVSGGSGITPVMSMLRELALRTGSSGPRAAAGATFVYYARTRADVVFARELEEHALFSGVELLVFTDDEQRGDVTRDLLAHVPDFAEREAFACGPPGMLTALRALYGEHGAEARLHTEAFTLPSAPLPSLSDPNAPTPEVRFARAAKTQKGTRTLLAMAEEAGLTPKAGCRMGICHTCTCRKVSGVTRDVRTGELSADADVDVRICVNEPVGNVVLDL